MQNYANTFYEIYCLDIILFLYTINTINRTKEKMYAKVCKNHSSCN